jgi:hypothetical protein
MSSQRLPNEDDVHRISDAEEIVGPHTAHEKQEEEPPTTTLPANEEEENKKLLQSKISEMTKNKL